MSHWAPLQAYSSISNLHMGANTKAPIPNQNRHTNGQLKVKHKGQLKVKHKGQLKVKHKGQLKVKHKGQLKVKHKDQ